MRAFYVAGAGIDWAWTGNWTLKIEYLYLGLNETFSVCGPGGGAAAGSTFCSNRSLDGRIGRFGRKAFVPTLREFNAGAFSEQTIHQMRTDKTRAACYENATH